MGDKIKETLDRVTAAQAGRVEFFKQALTLSLAGVAGCAALFTGTGGLPDDTGSRVMAVLSGLLLLGTAAWALMGLSTYANLLHAVAKESELDSFEHGMVGHARGAFVLLSLTAVAVMVYALLRLGVPAKSDDSGTAIWVSEGVQHSVQIRSIPCTKQAVLVEFPGGSSFQCLDSAALAKFKERIAANGQAVLQRQARDSRSLGSAVADPHAVPCCRHSPAAQGSADRAQARRGAP